MKQLWALLLSAKELWRYYIIVSSLTILVSAAALLQPLLSGWAIGEISKGHPRIGLAAWFAIGIFLLDLTQNLLNNISGYFGDQMSTKLNYILSRRYYEHLMELPQSYFDTELSGKIINRLNRSINQISNFVQIMSNNFLQFLFTTVFALAIVAYYSWPVAAMLLMLYPIYIFLTVKTSGKWSDYQTEKNKHLDIASGRFAESIGQIKVVKSFLQEKRELSFFNRHYRKVVSLNRPQSRYWHRQDILRRIILNVIFLLVYLYIFIQGAKGLLSPGDVVALILYGMQIRTPIFTISMLVQNFQRAVNDSRDYANVMQTRSSIVDPPNAVDLQAEPASITFSAVNFGYDQDKQVLHDINFSVSPGTKVALVGESGEGKTTITSLLLRLYDKSSGRIEINGQDIAEVSQQSLRQAIGIVFQEPALFSGTIKENISYSNPQATDEQIIAAAKAANADEFIVKFENGYDTEIGERGIKLSGGQKQRLAIARALLKDAPILILDEATSSLDSKSEQRVQEALERLMRGRTTLIIAHRLSTIQHVDTIITLKQGRIDEIGSPKQLQKSGGIYGQLLALQDASKEARTKQLTKYEIAA